MNAAASGRTWDDASSPAAVRLARRYEEAWQAADRGGRRLDPRGYLADAQDEAGATLAILRADLSLRWEAGDRAGAAWYLERFKDLGEDSVVALLYEEFCLREEDGERPDPASYLARYPALAEPLRRVLDIHELIGSATATNSILGAPSMAGPGGRSATDEPPYPEAGQTIAGFYLVEELGRGSFARVFLARERELADRPVALKVARRGSREPQALARLQHTHIVPVHSVREDRATGLHLLCMPFFGRVTLSRLLQEVRGAPSPSGRAIVEALDRLSGGDDAPPTHARSACRDALASRTYAQAIAWWGARLAEALDHAHDRGILHRDVKPSNVLVNDDGMPMLLDFNLARDGRPGDGGHGAEVAFGGTLDYMAPEHLEALADEASEGVDSRSDIFSLGVLLYEAVAGVKPYAPPRKNLPIYDSLLRAASDRRKECPVRFPEGLPSPVPASLAAVIRRCLEPEPADRYRGAGELAADLRAVADDLPLPHAREPFLSRLGGRLRRHRRVIFVAAGVALAFGGLLGVYTMYQVDRQDRYDNARAYYLKGCVAIDEGRFEDAHNWLEAAGDAARFNWRDTIRGKLRWGTFSTFGGQLRKRLENLWAGPSMDDLELNIEYKARMADLIGSTRRDADSLHAATENLRFRLIGLGDDKPAAIRDLKGLMEPFRVLDCREPGVTYERQMALLDEDHQRRLTGDVNELLFLWMVGVEEAFRRSSAGPEPAAAADLDRLEDALAVCDRALTFAEPREPWLSLRDLLAQHATPRTGMDAPGGGGDPRLPGEPRDIASVQSPNACFQWGLLNSSEGRRARAVEWLQQAVRLDWSSYWYHFYLGYLANNEGLIEDALGHFSNAVACRPGSAWVRFNRARLLRAKGRWGPALDDFLEARKAWSGTPNAFRVSLELGVLHTQLGDFAEAAGQYREILAGAPGTELARAARLNLANLDAESGREEAALATYDSLLEHDPADHSARLSRAYLRLRMGRPAEAIGDLDLLVRAGPPDASAGELMASRATGMLLLRRRDEALEDAAAARRLRPCPAADRLYERALLAAGRFGQVELGRVEEVRLLPVGGSWLRSDLQKAAVALEAEGRAAGPGAPRAARSRAIILSALGEHAEAISAARQHVEVEGRSPEAHLILARVLLNAGRARQALQRADAGLLLQPRDPEMLEVRGVALARLGRLEEALESLGQVIATTPSAYARARHAEVLQVSGRHEQAVGEWTNVLRADPEFDEAYLGRARAWVSLRSWDRAIADLETAATWSHGHLEQETKVLVAYAACLRERPGHSERWLALLQRTAKGWLRGGTAAWRPTVVAATKR
ncbi:Serine/threonine-protein kinase PknK [Aquisphaera giovannonii]|uniref:Serine/threonine-protein kinase PknK n=1 Tax=Aquisphaera giovannonii TaxID=406548 RepID=A0A5B9VZ90_9BACT|nr:serine/threonine-protein kinase [Aquisphaera giovannonii]QEH33598.1 Serine/threonine-protein kinase PknK [Aquisphaera giovannonii]